MRARLVILVAFLILAISPAVAYAVWRGLSAEAGFRYWRFDSGQGDVISRATNGTEGRARLDEAITERYGPSRSELAVLRPGPCG